MGSLFGKSSSSVTSGYRYYFAVLAGICRGPVDEIFLIKSASNIVFDAADDPDVPINTYDPDPAQLNTVVSVNDENGIPTSAPYAGGSIVGNTLVVINKPDLYGGEKSEGGAIGFLWTYFGAKNQLIPAADWIRTAMAGLLLPSLRGVLTTFYDGEVTANNPYPKAWKYRVRRALRGWDGPVWYPEKALMILTDGSIPAYTRTSLDTGAAFTTYVTGPDAVDEKGASTGSSTQYQVTSNYTGATINTYNSTGGLQTQFSVPREYNVINAMNPAHIVYECVTNRDWGRGMNRALIDHTSFAAAADQLFAEGFGLCIKWSRTEDIDAFVQVVIDHIAAAVYTDRVTGLLCIRLLRADYDQNALSTFDYNSGLLEVTSVNVSASDSNTNELIVKYYSPVLDDSKEARQQNLASISQLGCVFSTTKDYSGIPTSDLAIRVAARDLKIASVGWTQVSFTVDRRGYLITPGDCLILNAPERGLNRMVIRVATVEDSVLTDGSIKIVGARDVYSIPAQGITAVQRSEWLMPDNSPKPVTDFTVQEATYYDLYRVFHGTDRFTDVTTDPYIGYQAILAVKPSSASLSYKILERKYIHFSSNITPWAIAQQSGKFANPSTLKESINTTDTIFTITSNVDMTIANLPQVMLLSAGNYDETEFIYVKALSKDSNGNLKATVARGCIDTVAIPHKKGTRLFNYGQSAAVDSTEYTFNDISQVVLITHTTRGDLAIDNDPAQMPNRLYGFGARAGKPYTGSNFRVNGIPRDQAQLIDDQKNADIVMTWHHRNKEIQADQVLGEMEADVSPNADASYTVIFVNRNATYQSNTTSNTLTVNCSALVTAGFQNGDTIRVMLYTLLGNRPWWVGQAGAVPETLVTFKTTPPVLPASGFDVQFDQNFGS